MKMTRTIALELRFEVCREDPLDEEWEVVLERVEPRGVFSNKRGERVERDGCCSCLPNPRHGEPGDNLICDACAVEEYIAALGADAFLDETHEVEHGGTLVLSGHMEWSTYGDDADCDAEFKVESSRWEET